MKITFIRSSRSRSRLHVFILHIAQTRCDASRLSSKTRSICRRRAANEINDAQWPPQINRGKKNFLCAVAAVRGPLPATSPRLGCYSGPIARNLSRVRSGNVGTHSVHQPIYVTRNHTAQLLDGCHPTRSECHLQKQLSPRLFYQWRADSYFLCRSLVSAPGFGHAVRVR